MSVSVCFLEMYLTFYLVVAQATSGAEEKEAMAASNSIKANIVGEWVSSRIFSVGNNLNTQIAGKVQWGDFKDTYVLDQSKDALGTGMTGSVHEWQHKTTGQRVAIKCVRKRGLPPAHVTDMKKEIELLSQLDHPNIVKILDAFENEHTLALVMEICQGLELFDHLLFTAQYTQEVRVKLFCLREVIKEIITSACK